MDSIEATPTSAADYAAISAGYGVLASMLVLVARRGEQGPQLAASELGELGLGTFALSKLIAKEKVESWARAPFVEEAKDGERRPRDECGQRLPAAGFFSRLCADVNRAAR